MPREDDDERTSRPGDSLDDLIYNDDPIGPCDVDLDAILDDLDLISDAEIEELCRRTDEEMAAIQPLMNAIMAEVLHDLGYPPEEIAPYLPAPPQPRRRKPGSQPPKVRVTFRLDPDLLAALRGTGPGWQTRANAALRAWMKRRGCLV